MLYGYLEEIHQIDQGALNSVAQDIIEEQGGPMEDPSATLPPLDTPSQLISPEPAADNGGKDHAAPTSETDNRLASMEQSMSSLTDAVRQELQLLRQALLNQKDPDDDPEI